MNQFRDDDADGVEGEDWFHDLTFMPMFGVSMDPDTGIAGFENQLTLESINFPIERLDELIDQLTLFQRHYRADTDFGYDPFLAPLIGISLDANSGTVLLDNCLTSEKFKFPVDRLDELIEQLIRFRSAYKAGEVDKGGVDRPTGSG